MFLGREVDDPARPGEVVVWDHKHGSDLDLLLTAGLGVDARVLREGFAEHEGNALAHYTDFVDRVDQGLSLSLEEIALCVADHQTYHPGLAASFN